MKRLLTGLAGTALLLSAIDPALAITLSLEPVSQSIFAGDTATVNVNISGLGDGVAPSLGEFDLDITYDASVLTFNSLDFGNSLGDPLFEALTEVKTPVAGVIDFAEVSLLSEVELDPLQPSSFTLAALTFTGSNVGLSNLVFGDNVILGDASGNRLLDFTLETATITVEARDSETTPEPSTVISTALILALVGLSKKAEEN